MGRLLKPDPALILVGVLFREPGLLRSVRDGLEEQLGKTWQAGPQFDFEWTDFYQREMGPGLKRVFLGCQRLAGRELLADIKLFTNRIEQDLARQDGTRRVNLDPGLLSAENFVLASTKGRGHRVYLRDGIYAEVTLQFHQGRLQCFEWTYPDYRSEAVRGIIHNQRLAYLQRLRDSAGPDLMEVKL